MSFMAPDAPEISIVIPAYYAEAFIARAVTSVLEQPDVRPEIIVVVDGVFDRTHEIAAQFQHTKVIVNEKNRGAPVARNRGLAAASAPFVLFLDADDFLEGRLLSGLLQVALRDDVDLVFGPGLVQRPDGVRVDIDKPTSTQPMAIIRDWLAGRFVPTCSILWKASFVRRIGGWKAGVVKNQDGELVWRALIAGARPSYSSEGAGIYVHHQAQTRISARRDAARWRSYLEVADWLASELANRGQLDDGMRQALIDHLYGGMCQSYLWGHAQIAAEFETRWQELGGCRHRGTWLHRFGATLLGLPRKQRLSNQINLLMRRGA